MGNVQPNYNVAPEIGFAGALADHRFANIFTRICEPASIGFGLAVIKGTADKQVKLGANGQFVGLTVRDISLPAGNNDLYVAGNNVMIANKGAVFALAAAAVNAGDPVYRTATGTLTNAPGTRTAAFGTQTGNGNGTLPSITVNGSTPPEAGTYKLRFFEAASDLGYYEVIRDRDGAVIGVGKVGVAFNNGGLSFTIPDGATDWALNTTVVITVSGGNDLIPGAIWEKSVAQDAVSVVVLS